MQARPRAWSQRQRSRLWPAPDRHLECAQRIGVEFAFVENAAHLRALDEIVGQDFVPQVDYRPGLRETPVPADVEAIALVLDRAADPADVNRVLLDDADPLARLGRQIAGGQPGRTGADNHDIDVQGTRAPRCARFPPDKTADPS